jgi:hypothetical protein
MSYPGGKSLAVPEDLAQQPALAALKQLAGMAQERLTKISSNIYTYAGGDSIGQNFVMQASSGLNEMGKVINSVGTVFDNTNTNLGGAKNFFDGADDGAGQTADAFGSSLNGGNGPNDDGSGLG